MGKFSAANAARKRCPETGKVCLSRDEARRAARTLNHSQQRDRWPVHEFRCPDCGQWHTGHVRVQQQRRGLDGRARRRG